MQMQREKGTPCIPSHFEGKWQNGQCSFFQLGWKEVKQKKKDKMLRTFPMKKMLLANGKNKDKKKAQL